MQSYPKITVVTPNYNQADYIEETILSVLDQNYPNLEYIIIDGGSTDGSVEIIKKYSSNLAYWISEKDNGQYEAIQKGFLKSSGEIMTYINSDDIVSTNCLFSVAQLFLDYPQIEWMNGISNHIDEHGRKIWVGAHQRWNKYRYFNNDFEYIQQEGVFWRRSLWEKAGGYISTEYKIASDLELWSRFFQYTNLYTLSGILGSFRIRSSNQRSLEGIEEYTIEAKKIISLMPRTQLDVKYLQIANSFLFRILRRKKFTFFFKLLGFHEIQNVVFSFTPPIDFDRKLQKYLLKSGSKVTLY